MITGTFRPSGELTWLLNKLPSKKWALLGSIAPGERCLAAWRTLSAKRLLDHVTFLKIVDVPTPYWAGENERKLDQREHEYIADGGAPNSVVGADIRDSEQDIENYMTAFMQASGPNIIIDISTLPKRFFFPFVNKLLIESPAKNILITYTRPLGYDRDKPLSIDPDPWRELPRFKAPYPEPIGKKLIIGLGYEPLGLPQLLKGEDFHGVPVVIFFLFPATASGNQRNWEFMRHLDSEVGPYQHQPLRVNAYDVSAVFDCILTQTDRGREYAIFAPYGAKTMSLAMCLYATTNGKRSAVYYTQPRSYNPNYSFGVSSIRGLPETFAYCIRTNGLDHYHLP
jgi:hypothetical protein